MKKRITILMLLVYIISMVAITAFSTTEANPFFTIGEYFREYRSESNNPNHIDIANEDVLAASFHGKTIAKSTVEYQKKAISQTDTNNYEQLTDYDIVNEIVMNYIMIEEADAMGLTPSQDEIDAFVDYQRKIYETYPEAREPVDLYCEGAQISLDEYYEIIREDAFGILSKQKLQDEIGRQYCEENGLEFTKINPPQEMMDAIETYLDDLFHEYQSEIVYYIPVPE